MNTLSSSAVTAVICTFAGFQLTFADNLNNEDPHEATGMPVQAWQSTAPSWPTYETLWIDPQPISPDQLALWRNAVDMLGDESKLACSYTRITTPCRECPTESLPLNYADAAQHSLTEPGLGALGAWFDAPVLHGNSAWYRERFDLQSPIHWSLETVNGAQPSQEQQRSYDDEKSASFNSRANQIGRREGQIASGNFHPAIVRKLFDTHVPTVSLTSDSDLLYLGTPPNRKSKNPRAKAMQFTWLIDPHDGTLQAFDERAQKGFSPHFGLRFSNYRQRGLFSYDESVGAVVLSQLDYSFDSRLTLVFRITNEAMHWYSEFSCDPEQVGI